MTEVLLPRSLDAVWEILDNEPDAMLYAGGTDLLVKMRSDALKPRVLVCIERVEALHGVHDRGEEVFIAAATTHTDLLGDATVRSDFPILAEALRLLGSPPVRNVGTIGGNIMTASPAGDTLPPLYVLEAEIEVRSRDKTRRIPVKDFILGPGTVALQHTEILTGVWLKRNAKWNVQWYEKVGRRRALACSIVNMAALLHIAEDGIVVSARLAWGSVGPTVVTSRAVEEALEGLRLSQQTLEVAGALVLKVIQPIDDMRASAEYRRFVAGALLLRLLGVEPRPSASRDNA